jgi:hypothetical protein
LAAAALSSGSRPEPEVAEPVYAAARASLAAAKDAQAALAASGDTAKQHLNRARAHAKDSRTAAETAVLAYQQTRGSDRARTAAEAAVRAAEAAAVEVEVAARAITTISARRKPEPPRQESREAEPQPEPKAEPKRAPNAVASRGLQAPPTALPKSGGRSELTTEIEAFATTAAKANADAQMAAMNAEAAGSPYEAALYVEAAAEAAEDAQSAAEAATQALARAEDAVRKDPGSVPAQAQLEIVTRAAETARLHAEAAADAAARAVAARWSGGGKL